MLLLNKRTLFYFACLVLVVITSCTVQGELEKEAVPITITRGTPAPPTPTETTLPTIAPTAISVDMITVVPFPAYLFEVFPDPASITNISSEAYLTRLKRYEYFLNEPSLCAAINSYHLMEKGDAPTPDEFLRQMYLVADEQVIMEPNVVVSLDILGSEILDPETGKVLFRTPDGEHFNVCWPVDLSRRGLHTATFVFTKTSGRVESYTWSFVIEQ